MFASRPIVRTLLQVAARRFKSSGCGPRILRLHRRYRALRYSEHEFTADETSTAPMASRGSKSCRTIAVIERVLGDSIHLRDVCGNARWQNGLSAGWSRRIDHPAWRAFERRRDCCGHNPCNGASLIPTAHAGRARDPFTPRARNMRRIVFAPYWRHTMVRMTSTPDLALWNTLFGNPNCSRRRPWRKKPSRSI
jgi:hypothetical protein